MILFLMTLLVMRFASDIPSKAGGKPKQKPPDFELIDEHTNYVTAFFWEMYGAQNKLTAKGKLA